MKWNKTRKKKNKFEIQGKMWWKKITNSYQKRTQIDFIEWTLLTRFTNTKTKKKMMVICDNGHVQSIFFPLFSVWNELWDPMTCNTLYLFFAQRKFFFFRNPISLIKITNRLPIRLCRISCFSIRNTFSIAFNHKSLISVRGNRSRLGKFSSNTWEWCKSSTIFIM